MRLTTEEAWDVIERAHTGVLTTLRADGAPIALPVWFVVDDRRIYVSGPAHTKKMARVRRDPRVSFLVESGERWSELVGVHVTGRARVIEELDRCEEIASLLDGKYAPFRTARGDMPERTRSYYARGVSTIEIEPDERILSWDNARLFAPPDP